MTSSDHILHRSDLTGEWTVVPDRSTVEVKNKTFWGLLTVTGSFSEFSGSGTLGDDGTVSGRVDVRAGSITTGIGKRDEHLRSPDFLDADRYPDITLVVTSAQPTGPQEARLQGDLTVRDVTRPIQLPVTLALSDATTVRVVGTVTVERAAFGVAGNMAGMVGATTTLTGDLVFRRATG